MADVRKAASSKQSGPNETSKQYSSSCRGGVIGRSPKVVYRGWDCAASAA